MSHAARIDYEALSLTARITCEEALRQLCKMDELLERIKSTASNLLTDRVKDYEEYLLNERTRLQNQIDDVLSKSKVQNRDRNIANTANRLSSYVTELMTNRLMLIEDVIDEELIKTVKRKQKERRDEKQGIISISKENIVKLSSIDDFALREETYKVLIENQSITFEVALKNAKNNIKNKNNNIIRSKKNELLQSVKKEMEEAGVDSKTIEETVSVDINNIGDVETLKQKSSKEIIGEKVRKETLKIISKTIKSRGFIVDKKNIKIDRKKNEVKLIAQKASGEKAEFRIYLDGKFIYKFDGYEGQACQEDLQPFMTDLSDVYDIKVLEQTEIWSNPDKISSMKYQTINNNKGTN